MYVSVRIYGEKEFMKAKMHRAQESYDVALVMGKTILKKKLFRDYLYIEPLPLFFFVIIKSYTHSFASHV